MGNPNDLEKVMIAAIGGLFGALMTSVKWYIDHIKGQLEKCQLALDLERQETKAALVEMRRRDEEERRARHEAAKA